MKYGLTDSELKFLNEKLVLPLKKLHAQVFIFGSRAINRHKKFSDIDVVYLPDPKFPVGSGAIQQIISGMEDSQFPYKIDLVNYNELASTYKAQIDLDKIEL